MDNKALSDRLQSSRYDVSELQQRVHELELSLSVTHEKHRTCQQEVFYFFLYMRLRPIVGQPGNSSIISGVELGQTTVQLRKRAGFNDVGHRLRLTTGAQISVCKALS